MSEEPIPVVLEISKERITLMTDSVEDFILSSEGKELMKYFLAAVRKGTYRALTVEDDTETVVFKNVRDRYVEVTYVLPLKEVVDSKPTIQKSGDVTFYLYRKNSVYAQVDGVVELSPKKIVDFIRRARNKVTEEIKKQAGR